MSQFWIAAFLVYTLAIGPTIGCTFEPKTWAGWIVNFIVVGPFGWVLGFLLLIIWIGGLIGQTVEKVEKHYEH